MKRATYESSSWYGDITCRRISEEKNGGVKPTTQRPNKALISSTRFVADASSILWQWYGFSGRWTGNWFFMGEFPAQVRMKERTLAVNRYTEGAGLLLRNARSLLWSRQQWRRRSGDHSHLFSRIISWSHTICNRIWLEQQLKLVTSDHAIIIILISR